MLIFNIVGQTDAIVSLLLTKPLIVKPKMASDFFFVYRKDCKLCGIFSSYANFSEIAQLKIAK